MPQLAPTQVIVVPIPQKENQRLIMETCEKVTKKLRSLGFRVEVDRREELTPGAKFFYWELRGVPIRMEIGPRDVEKEQVILVRRDNFQKEACRITDLPKRLPQLAEQITTELREKAQAWANAHVHRVDTSERANELLKRKAGIVELPWCGDTECGHQLEERVNARMLGTPLDCKEKTEGKCAVCGKKTSSLVRMAVAY